MTNVAPVLALQRANSPRDFPSRTTTVRVQLRNRRSARRAIPSTPDGWSNGSLKGISDSPTQKRTGRHPSRCAPSPKSVAPRSCPVATPLSPARPRGCWRNTQAAYLKNKEHFHVSQSRHPYRFQRPAAGNTGYTQWQRNSLLSLATTRRHQHDRNGKRKRNGTIAFYMAQPPTLPPLFRKAHMSSSKVNSPTVSSSGLSNPRPAP